MRIIFMGTPEFAVPSLEILIEHGYEVVAVITATDKWGGRGGKELLVSPVKACAQRHGIPVLQPEKLKDEDFLAELRSYKADLQVVVAFRMLPEAVWAMPPYSTFNLHASLLPQYRGAAPINWAIINGDTETGVTTFFLRHEIDTGDLIYQEREAILPDDNAQTLYERLRVRGAGLVLRTVESIAKGIAPRLPQPQIVPLLPAPKIFKETCQIDWQQSRQQVHNFVRGLAPYPAAWTHFGDKSCKILRTILDTPHTADSADTHPALPTAYLTDNKSYLYLRCADGWLAIEELQVEGKKRMPIAAFLAGNKY